MDTNFRLIYHFRFVNDELTLIPHDTTSVGFSGKVDDSVRALAEKLTELGMRDGIVINTGHAEIEFGRVTITKNRWEVYRRVDVIDA